MLFTLKREYGIILKYQINYFCSITHLKNQDGGMNLAIISLLTNQHFQSTSFCQLMISLMFSKLWIHNFYMNIEAYFCLRWKVKRLVFLILNKFLCIWWFSVQPKNLWRKSNTTYINRDCEYMKSVYSLTDIFSYILRGIEINTGTNVIQRRSNTLL